MALQTLTEALALLAPDTREVALDYLADMGRTSAVLTDHGPQVVLA